MLSFDQNSCSLSRLPLVLGSVHGLSCAKLSSIFLSSVNSGSDKGREVNGDPLTFFCKTRSLCWCSSALQRPCHRVVQALPSSIFRWSHIASQFAWCEDQPTSPPSRTCPWGKMPKCIVRYDCSPASRGRWGSKAPQASLLLPVPPVFWFLPGKYLPPHQ